MNIGVEGMLRLQPETGASGLTVLIDAQYFEHHLEIFRWEIRSWITETMKPVPEMHFLYHYMIDGNRVAAVVLIVFRPQGLGKDFSFNVHVILHYA